MGIEGNFNKIPAENPQDRREEETIKKSEKRIEEAPDIKDPIPEEQKMEVKLPEGDVANSSGEEIMKTMQKEKEEKKSEEILAKLKSMVNGVDLNKIASQEELDEYVELAKKAEEEKFSKSRLADKDFNRLAILRRKFSEDGFKLYGEEKQKKDEEKISEIRENIREDGTEKNQEQADKMAEEKFSDYKADIEQVTTRGDGKLEKGEEFNKSEIDFGASLEHLKIHHDGEVAGSQFNDKIIKTSQEAQILLKKLLPEKMNYDQFERAEITIDISNESEQPIGWSGVKSIEEIKEIFPDAEIKQEIRTPGGEEAVENGVEGAWYPETARNPETGKFEVVKDEEGNIKNPKAKFEPKANIAEISSEKFKAAAETNKLTLIIQKDKQTEKPTVLTVYPGEIAPPYPAKIDTENFKLDTLKNSQEEKFWENHAYIKIKK